MLPAHPHTHSPPIHLKILLFFNVLISVTSSAQENDGTVTTIAFGSCHNSEKQLKRSPPPETTIWETINRHIHPDLFLWTGDSVYPKEKGTASLSSLKRSFVEMKENPTLGYAKHLNPVFGVEGTWDDHDYGGNDRGSEMPDRAFRRDLFLDFLNVSPEDGERRHRNGVYHSVEYGSRGKKVLVVMLDTRWGRDRHCIPSLADNKFVPLGNILACVTRWITAGLDLSRLIGCGGGRVLEEEQWEWLERVLDGSDADVTIVVSSIQILTSNPLVESWGQFPAERERLVRILEGRNGLVLLSGDVHHAEMLSPLGNLNDKEEKFLEVTSSGLTHSCETAVYAPLCKPILDSFTTHRFKHGRDDGSASYYTGINFGSIQIDWENRSLVVNVHDENGLIVLSTGSQLIDRNTHLSELEISNISDCVDGHLIPLLWKLLTLALCLLVYYAMRSIQRKNNKLQKKGCKTNHESDQFPIKAKIY